jgi:DNA-binding SARP family transcriptional activator
MEFRILGPLEVIADDGRPVPIDRPKARELMLVLILMSAQPASPARLAGALYGDSAVSTMQPALRTRIHELRRALAPDRLKTFQDGRRQLRVLPGELDSETFRSLASHGQQALDRGDHSGAVRLLQQAMDIWREPVWEIPPVPPSLASAVTELDDLRKDCRDALVDARLAIGQHTAVIPQLRDVVRADPLREHPWAQLMLAQYRSGQRTDALKTYAQARKSFVTELGLDPGPELEVLHRQVLAGDDEPLIGGRSEPGPAAAAPPAWTGICQLPAAPADFTGRGAEVDLLQRRLATGAMTITVISGPAGTGKTALTLYGAHQAHDRFPDGQLFARLGGPGRERDPQDVLEEMLHALGISAERIPPAGPEREALYRAILAHRKVLVIADDAATAAQVRPLLPGTDGSAVLVTSRSRLAGLEAAQLVNLGELPAGEAVALLGKIAGPGCAPDDEALAAIAAHCGHLPLALRVAGSRLAFEPGLTPPALAQALSSQQHRLAELAIGDVSVTAQLDAACHALSEQDRWVFRLASVHPADIPGWFLAGSAVPITAAGLLTEVPAPGEAGPWYRIHPLTRLYAGTRLAAEDPPEAVMAQEIRMITSWLEIAGHADRQLERHAYLPPSAALALPTVAPAAECAAAAADAAGWFARHHATLMALTRQACSVDLSRAAALADCQFGSLCQRREFEAGQQLWQWIATAASAAGDTLAAARARHRLAALMVAGGSGIRQAARMLAGCLPAFSLARDKQALASTHYLVALCGIWDDDPAVAFRNAEDGLAEARQAGDSRCACLNMSVMGAVLAGVGRTEEGLSVCNDALALATKLGDPACADAAGHMLARARLMVDRPPMLGRWSDRSWTAGIFPG